MICGQEFRQGFTGQFCCRGDHSFGCNYLCLDWRVLEGFARVAGAFWSSGWLLSPRTILDFLSAWWLSLLAVGFLSRKEEALQACWVSQGHLGCALLIRAGYRGRDTDSTWWGSVKVTLHSRTWDERCWWSCLDHTVYLQILRSSLFAYIFASDGECSSRTLSHAACISPTLRYMTSGTWVVGNRKLFVKWKKLPIVESLKAINILQYCWVILRFERVWSNWNWIFWLDIPPCLVISLVDGFHDVWI